MASLTNKSKSTSSLANRAITRTPSVVSATYYGFGAFTFVTTTGGAPIAWINRSKN